MFSVFWPLFESIWLNLYEPPSAFRQCVYLAYHPRVVHAPWARLHKHCLALQVGEKGRHALQPHPTTNTPHQTLTCMMCLHRFWIRNLVKERLRRWDFSLIWSTQSCFQIQISSSSKLSSSCFYRYMVTLCCNSQSCNQKHTGCRLRWPEVGPELTKCCKVPGACLAFLATCRHSNDVVEVLPPWTTVQSIVMRYF